MRKKILYSIAIVTMVLFSACNNEDALPEANLEAGGKISLTATMPVKPTSRVSLEQDGKTIDLKWENSDELQLVFVQGGNKLNSTATVTNILEGGNKAQFNIVLPEGLDENADFNLYGVYGGGGIDPGTTNAILPSNVGDASSLQDMQANKNVMLYFTSEDINLTTDPDISVTFEHLGSLFSITLKNISATENLENFAKAQLVGQDAANESWAYNSGSVAQSFDLETGEFQNKTTGDNFISFNAVNSSLAAGESMILWGWYPPLAENEWPQLELELRDDSEGLIIGSSNNTPLAKTPIAGKSYYLYAAWDGSNLELTDDSFIPSSNTFEVATMGTLGTTVLTETQKANLTVMKLTGEINATDFAVMKSDMPNLLYLDLSDVICDGNKIPGNAFGSSAIATANTTITNIILPPSIETIELNAFRQCTALTDPLILPAELKTIGSRAFMGCLGFSGDLVIPNKVTAIGQSAFHGVSRFTGTLTLSDELLTIGQSAFQTSTLFSGTLIIPDKVTTIGQMAFFRLQSITGLVIGNNVTTIAEQAFQRCLKISGDVTIPISVQTIGTEAFDQCDLVDAFIFPHSSVFPYSAGMLPAGVTIKVPASLVAQYKSDANWIAHKDDIEAI